MKKILFSLICFLLISTQLSAKACEPAPTDQLKPAITQLIEIIQDDSLQGEEKIQARRHLLMSAIANCFDFREMSRRILGETWKTISRQQQDSFILQMTKLLENVYIEKLENYSGSNVEFVTEKIRGKKALVTTMVDYKGSPLPIHYILYKQQTRWMVYDINIEGVSLVRNYMTQFRSIIRRQNFQDLMLIIEEKNRSFT